MKTYKLSKSILIFFFLVLIFMTFIGILVFNVTFISHSEDHQPTWFLVIWLFILCWNWYHYLKMPFEIKIQDDSSIEFRSLIKRIVVMPYEIKSIKSSSLTLGYITIEHAKGKISLINKIDGFYDFISTLKSLNPNIEVKGC